MRNLFRKKRYATIEKLVGETPLQSTEKLRASDSSLASLPLAYAGRLDPMASGKLLILIGDECKKQTDYHALDKTYTFQVLFGLSSDTGDVLGMLTEGVTSKMTHEKLAQIATTLVGPIELPYPHYSSKTVQGKPLHTWALEGRVNEIEIPTKKSTVHSLKLKELTTISKNDLCASALGKINSLPEVTEASKALGADFRRVPIRESWKSFRDTSTKEALQIATFSCTASSGTYMRSLAEIIAERAGTCGLAFSIHRTTIGKYYAPLKIWTKRF